MKIKTKLQLIIICNILLLVGILSVNLLSQKQAEKHLKQQTLVMELNMAIFERARLREEYFLYRQDRSKEQFLLIHKQIDGLIERMSGTFTGLEEKVFLNNMTGFHTKIGAYFNQLVRVDQSATVHTATTQALRERIISQMLVNADLLYREGLKLLRLANEETVYQNNLAHRYSNIVFGLLALFVITFAVIIIRSVTYPLTRLHKGTEIIAAGNLDYKTNIRTPDEIGQLSNAFDSMTENLRKTTVSRDELSKEIEIRKRAEETLRESKEFVENLIGSMQDGFSVLDSDGVQIDVNAAFCQMTGFSREELIGVGTPHPYWPPEAYEEIEKGFQKTLRGEFSDVELTFMRKNGERFPVIVSPSWVKDKQGNVTNYFATVKDITERKRAEEEKRRLEERSRKVVEDIFRFIPEGVLVFSRKMELLRQNQAFRELVSGYAKRLGFAEDELENLIIDKIKAGMGDKNIDEFVKSRKGLMIVIPANPGSGSGTGAGIR